MTHWNRCQHDMDPLRCSQCREDQAKYRKVLEKKQELTPVEKAVDEAFEVNR